MIDSFDKLPALPAGWMWTRLGDIRLDDSHSIIPSKTPLSLYELYSVPSYDTKRPEIIRGQAIGSNKIIVDKNTVLLCKINPRINRVWVVKNYSEHCKIASTEWIPFFELKGIYPEYLSYFMKNSCFRDFLATNTSGVGGSLMRINSTVISRYPLPLPPLREQHRIVAKIEELFSELDKGVEALKTAQQQLKVYRQAVLNSAIAGDTSKTIEEVVVSLDQGWSPKCYNEPSGNHQEWGVIKTTAIQTGYFQEMENKRLPENLQPRTQHELKKGDLLITRAGPRVRVGICCLVKKVRPRLLNCDKVYRIRTNTKVAIPEYIEILLNSPKYSREIEKMKTGISDSGVNLTQKGLLKIVISIPSIEQQTKIVQEIETRLSVADKLEETITQSLQQAEALRQSILKKAFEGKLVPQDPNDEPASKLLERIKAEKAAQTPVNGTVKRRGAGRIAASSMSAAVGKP